MSQNNQSFEKPVQESHSENQIHETVENISIDENSNSALVRANIQPNSANITYIPQTPSKLEKFSGAKGQHPRLWMKLAKLHLHFLQIPSKYQVQFIGLSLSGMPQAWFFGLNQHTLNSFASFEIVFLETFSSNRLMILDQIHECKQISGESVLEYTVRLRTLLDPLWSQWDSIMKTYTLSRGFYPKIREYVLLNQSERPTWSEIFKLAQKFESVTSRQQTFFSFEYHRDTNQVDDKIVLLEQQNASLLQKVANLEQQVLLLKNSVSSRTCTFCKSPNIQQPVRNIKSAKRSNKICWYCDQHGHTKSTCKIYLKDKRVKSRLNRTSNNS